jgi:hypothetical protein
MMLDSTKVRSYWSNEPASCCLLKPGGLRLLRILSIAMGLDKRAEKATELRKSWPPPSRMLPSIKRLAMDTIDINIVPVETFLSRESSFDVPCLVLLQAGASCFELELLTRFSVATARLKAASHVSRAVN